MRRTGDEGAVTVETALVLPALLALVGGVMVFALHMWASAVVDHAAQVGLRTAALRSTLPGATLRGPLPRDGYAKPDEVATVLGNVLVGGVTAGVCTSASPGNGQQAGDPDLARLGSGQQACVAVAHVADTDGRNLQGDRMTVTVLRRVPALEAAARFVPGLGPRLAARLGTVRGTARGRLE